MSISTDILKLNPLPASYDEAVRWMDARHDVYSHTNVFKFVRREIDRQVADLDAWLPRLTGRTSGANLQARKEALLKFREATYKPKVTKREQPAPEVKGGPLT